METKEVKEIEAGEIDIEKLKQLVNESEPRVHPHCADCRSEKHYCPIHQKAEAYLDRFFDRGSNEFEKYYQKYIVT